MTANQLLTGAGLVLALAVDPRSWPVSRLRIPAIIVLLPARFVAEALTTTAI